MPSPIAHLSVGLAIHETVRRYFRVGDGRIGRLFFFALVMGLSILPDFDSIFGLLLHDFGRYHNNLTHGLLSGVVIGLLAGLAAHLLRRTDALRWAALGAGCTLVHILMDFCTEGRGVMLLWPSTTRYTAPLKLFFGLHWSQSVTSPMHAVTLLNELPLAVLVLLLVWRARSSQALETRP
ncbi:MAG: metal-dependent hydrolase [Lentisphaerae bacterium]|nr:metal-dependent hydrolase [Lentisphaerota bacterium]